MSIPFIDAHIHLWDLDRLRYAWLSPPFDDTGVNGSTEAIASTYLPWHYRSDSSQFDVRGTVHIDAGAHPDDALAETKWLQQLSSTEALPTAIVAFAALDASDVEQLLEAHCEFPAVRGIRHIINWHPNPRFTYTPHNLLDDPQWERGYAALADFNLSFDLQIYSNQMERAAQIAARHERVPVMLNHAGMPVDDGEGYLQRWETGMRRLAQLPHVSVKVSGLGLANHQWTTESIQSIVMKVIDIFGVDRVMFGSDVPTDKLFSDYTTILRAFDTITAGFSISERAAMFSDNANRLYRLGIDL